jgi:hypothetical protein
LNHVRITGRNLEKFLPLFEVTLKHDEPAALLGNDAKGVDGRAYGLPANRPSPKRHSLATVAPRRQLPEPGKIDHIIARHRTTEGGRISLPGSLAQREPCGT